MCILEIKWPKKNYSSFQGLQRVTLTLHSELNLKMAMKLLRIRLVVPRKNRIRVLAGDRVQVEMTTYDLTKGRRNFRHK